MPDNVAVTRLPISKDIAQLSPRRNLVAYATVRAEFDWAKARAISGAASGEPRGRHQAPNRGL
jgi:hypothetical protein